MITFYLWVNIKKTHPLHPGAQIQLSPKICKVGNCNTEKYILFNLNFLFYGVKEESIYDITHTVQHQQRQ